MFFVPTLFFLFLGVGKQKLLQYNKVMEKIYNIKGGIQWSRLKNMTSKG